MSVLWVLGNKSKCYLLHHSRASSKITPNSKSASRRTNIRKLNAYGFASLTRARTTDARVKQ